MIGQGAKSTPLQLKNQDWKSNTEAFTFQVKKVALYIINFCKRRRIEDFAFVQIKFQQLRWALVFSIDNY